MRCESVPRYNFSWCGLEYLKHLLWHKSYIKFYFSIACNICFDSKIVCSWKSQFQLTVWAGLTVRRSHLPKAEAAMAPLLPSRPPARLPTRPAHKKPPGFKIRILKSCELIDVVIIGNHKMMYNSPPGGRGHLLGSVQWADSLRNRFKGSFYDDDVSTFFQIFVFIVC